MANDPSESLQPKPTRSRYSSAAMAFHWSMFILVVIVGVLGLLHDDWPKTTQSFWINIHALVGLLLWFTLIARLLWRFRHTPPPLSKDAGILTRRFSSPVHWTLYALLFVIPVIGMVTFVYHGRILDFGLFRIDLGVKRNHAVFGPTEDIHGYLAYALFALAALHALAAFWHRFYLHDGVLDRMWPWSRD